VHGDHGSLPAGQPVLASAQFPSPVEVPDPDIDIDGERPPDSDQPGQESWANQGVDNAERLIKLLTPQQDGLAPTEVNLMHESQEAVAQESKTVFDDDLYYIEHDSDYDYGQQMCKALDYIDALIKIGTLRPNDPKSVADVLMSLESSTDPAPANMIDIVNNTYNLFQAAFPQCNSSIDTVQWIIEQMENLFCGSGET
jgi:hypothetical protein